ncbi:MAG: hypothetical protein ABIG39_00650 [Candidatus Micrarchaeota archaeon]
MAEETKKARQSEGWLINLAFWPFVKGYHAYRYALLNPIKSFIFFFLNIWFFYWPFLEKANALPFEKYGLIFPIVKICLLSILSMGFFLVVKRKRIHEIASKKENDDRLRGLMFDWLSSELGVPKILLPFFAPLWGLYFVGLLFTVVIDLVALFFILLSVLLVQKLPF